MISILLVACVFRSRVIVATKDFWILTKSTLEGRKMRYGLLMHDAMSTGKASKAKTDKHKRRKESVFCSLLVAQERGEKKGIGVNGMGKEILPSPNQPTVLAKQENRKTLRNKYKTRGWWDFIDIKGTTNGRGGDRSK